MPQGFGLGLGLSRSSVAVPPWVVNRANPPDIMFDFHIGRAWRKAGGVASAASLLTTVRASTGYVNNAAGVWTSVASNLPRISDLGLLVEEARTNSNPNSSMQGAEATDNVELLTNWDFQSSLAGWTATNTGGSSFAWASAGTVNLTWDGTNATSIDQSFATVIGRTYTIRVAFRSVTTMTSRIDIGTSQGGSQNISGTTLGVGPAYIRFVATATTTWVRIRGSGTAGSAVLYSVSAMLGGVPTLWSIVDGDVDDIDVYFRVTAVATDPTEVEYIRARIFGTVGASTSNLGLRFENASTIAATAGQVWSGSIFERLAAGSTTGFTSFVHTIASTNGSSTLATNSQPFTPTAALTRDQFPAQTISNGAGTASNAYHSVIFNMSAGSTLNLSLDIGWPQLELGASVTSPIRTTTVAVARAADVVSMTTPPTYGSAYSLYAKGTPQAPTTYGTTQVFAHINDGSNTNALVIQRNSATGNIQASSVTGGVGTSIGPGVSLAQNVSAKFAVADANADQAASLNGGSISTGAGTLPVGVAYVYFGAQFGGSLFLNGFLAEAAIWASQRVPNAQLQSMAA